MNHARNTVVRAMQDHYREYAEDFDFPRGEDEADAILAALRALPVEQRMEAMGMRAVDLHGGQRVVWVED